MTTERELKKGLVSVLGRVRLGIKTPCGGSFKVEMKITVILFKSYRKLIFTSVVGVPTTVKDTERVVICSILKEQRL